MSVESQIEWTDATWNPVRGCTKISPGCVRCYAEVFAERFRGVPGHAYERGFDLRIVPEKLAEPLRWPTSKLVFVNSMSDLFHKDVPTDYIVAVGKVMVKASWHVFQILTKRADRMTAMLRDELAFASQSPHIWWGTSVENKRHGFPRLELIRKAKAAVKFLSVEPLIEDLGKPLDLSGIDWVIVGGESGPGARPMSLNWVRSIRAECKRQKVPFFFKQIGGVRKGEAGRELDGRTYDDMPERANTSPPDRTTRLKLFAEGQVLAAQFRPAPDDLFTLL